MNQAVPGTLNYVEGTVQLNGQVLSSNAVGSAIVQPGQFIQTGQGKAEILLTPGVFLRLDRQSALMMVTPSLTHTEVELERGRAEVEVDQIYKENYILIDQKNGGTRLLKPGLYEFNANDNTMRVFDGKAAVFAGTGMHDGDEPTHQKAVIVKGGHQLVVSDQLGKPTGFDKKNASTSDGLYRWSSLRSEYLGEENLELASEYAGNGGFAPGWAWDPYFYGYTWLPGNGLFWNPFGWGFYSPYYIWGGGFIYGRGYRGGYGYGGGYGYRGGYGRAGFAGHGAMGGGGGFHGGGGGHR
ncbi:MAG TPA: hypothetical protein VGG18_11650 [Granulicella sp.]